MNLWKSAIERQFHAALDMLGNAMHACPGEVWSAPGPHAFWHLAFHTLFFVDLYLSEEDEDRFHPPPPFGLTELEDNTPPERTYSKDELHSYLDHCRRKLNAVMAAMTETWAANPCPFSYRDMSNGELLLYNMRHVQHHAAQLNMLLRQKTNSAPDWVSKGRQHTNA